MKKSRYYDGISKELKSYFKILSPVFPEWLHEYIDTDAMRRIGHISMDCGCDYTNLFERHPWHSNLDHSVGVALIIWNFTKDKKATLAGLFHDIATPVFKHCIDFMNGDSETQESTEEKTYEMIKNSTEIMNLLDRDNIKIEEVADYKIYPIADNDSPHLAADRFEYNFGCGLIIHPFWTLEKLKKCYDDVTILTNEYGEKELGFKTIEVAEEYIEVTSKLWPIWISPEDRITMQFLADMCLTLQRLDELTIDELYELKESEVIDRIKNSSDESVREAFLKFESATKCYISDEQISDRYCINVTSKSRYLNPLVKTTDGVVRIYDISPQAKENIDNYLNLPKSGFVYFDFDFIPKK